MIIQIRIHAQFCKKYHSGKLRHVAKTTKNFITMIMPADVGSGKPKQADTFHALKQIKTLTTDPESHRRTSRLNTDHLTTQRRKRLIWRKTDPKKTQRTWDRRRKEWAIKVLPPCWNEVRLFHFTHLWHHNTHKNTNGRYRQWGKWPKATNGPNHGNGKWT